MKLNTDSKPEFFTIRNWFWIDLHHSKVNNLFRTHIWNLLPLFSLQALLKMDCQGLVARLVMDFVLLTTAVEVAGRWREMAERLVKISRQQMDAYEAPHRDKNGVVDSEVRVS